MAVTLATYWPHLERFLESFEGEFGYRLEDPFDEICAMLGDREPFAFSRFGDGEFFAIFEESGENCDGHPYYPEMGRRLREILGSQPDYIVGLQPLAVMRHGAERIRALSGGIHWAYSDSLHTAMVEKRLMSFFDALDGRDAVLVGPNHLQPLSRAKGWAHVSVPSRNCWLQYDEVKAEAMDAAAARDTVLLICASMMSNVLVDDLHAARPKNTHIDVGSVFDPIVGVKSRPFYDELVPPFRCDGAELPPGSELSPARQTARLVMRPLELMRELRSRYGDTFTIRLAEQPPWVVTSDPDSIRRVFQAPADVLHGGEGKHVLRPVVGEHSVLLLDGERHLEQRRLLLRPFDGNHVARYERAMRAAAERAIETRPFGEPIAALEWMREIALDVILRAVFGLRDGAGLEPLREALAGLRLPANARESGAPAFQATIARIDELIFAEIAARRAERSDGRDDDVLSLLLAARHEDGTPLARDEIRDELMSLLVAGHETTATTLSWALAELARDPEALAQVSAEAEEGGNAYTDAAIQETLRLRPALPVVARAVKSPFELDGHTIPPGVSILPAILLVHRREDIYPDPDSFRPERFLGKPPDPAVWMPFGGGSRRCLGARFALHEMRIVLSTLLQRVRVKPASDRHEAMRCRNVTLVPSRGAEVLLEPRRANTAPANTR